MVLIISGTNVISGAEYVLSDYLKHSHKNNFIIVTSNNDEVINFYENLNAFKVISSKCLAPAGASNNKKIIGKIIKIQRFLLSKKLINKTIKEFNVKKIVGNNTLDIIYSVWVKNVSNVEYYQYIHDMIEKDSLISKLILKFDKYVNKYFVVSNAVKVSLCNIGIDNKKIILIYNGLLPIKYIPKNINSKLVIGFLGALNNRKSPLDFVEFIKRSNYKGIIAYHMSEDSTLEKIKSEIKKYNLDIKLIGKVERNNLNEFYKKIDFLFVPSKRDPLPTVVLESFNYSTPVIGRNVDGIPEMINENFNGYLFQNNDNFDKIIYKINKLENKTFKKMCFNANLTIKDKFNLNEKVDKLNNLLFDYIK